MASESGSRLALVLPGGGARGAYQAGVLARIGEALPSLRVPIVTGVSAGAINAAFLASRSADWGEASEALAALWGNIATEQVVETSRLQLARGVLRWGVQLASGGVAHVGEADSLLDTSPLRGLLGRALGADERGQLPGIAANVQSGALESVAITATNYCTGRAETFVHGVPRRGEASWSRPYRVASPTRLSVEHVMASCAIPVLFPPIGIGDGWYGDGGVRQVAPLSPAVHLGADRILVSSTTRGPSVDALERGPCHTRPSPGRILGVVANALLNDQSEYDAAHLRRISRLAAGSPAAASEGLRPVRLLSLRPSVDLGSLAAAYERALPPGLRRLLGGWGREGSSSNDLLSTLLFEGAYTRELIDCGRRDVEARLDEVVAFLRDDA